MLVKIIMIMMITLIAGFLGFFAVKHASETVMVFGDHGSKCAPEVGKPSLIYIRKILGTKNMDIANTRMKEPPPLFMGLG